MTPRFIAQCLVGLVALLGVTTLVRGRARVPGQPDLALSTLPASPLAPPIDEALAARRRIVIEPLPVPMVTVKLANVNTQETGTFHIGSEGEVSADEAAAIETFFRCRRSGRHMTMAPGVLAMLADVAKHWPGRTIEVISGFRAPPFGAPHSKHFRGHAIDLRVKGVRTAVLRDYVWRGHHQVGVGHYPSTNFVHMDSRPGEPDTAWTATDEEGVPNYHPRWALRARRVKKGGPAHSAPSLAAATLPGGPI
jgi:uncharacterized protein YcbK (DUF882 family)